jgi:hypothetical protein
LCLLWRRVLDAVELGDSVDQPSNFWPEVLLDLMKGYLGVFNGVVQQGRSQDASIETVIGQDLCHGYRVGDVRVARLSNLSAMSGFGDVVSAPDQIFVGLREMPAMGLEEAVKDRFSRIG